MTRKFLALSFLLLCVGCDPELKHDPVDNGGPDDGGPQDGSTDGGPLPDGRVPECRTNTHCDSKAPKCVDLDCAACTSDEDCQRFPETPSCMANGECGECSASNESACTGTATPVCSTGGNECVQCNEDADCSSPASSKCDTITHECKPCEESTQCSHLEGKSVCAAGACVECTREDAAACADGSSLYVCDPATHACDTTRKVHSKTLCNACVDATDAACSTHTDCVSDDECQSGQACVDVPAGAGAKVCQQIKDIAACPRPYVSVTAAPILSADGESVRVCTFAVPTTTCQAHADYKTVRCGAPLTSNPEEDEPDSGDDTKCGAPGIEDGQCSLLEALNQYLCTVPCTSVLDCPRNVASCEMPAGVCSL